MEVWECKLLRNNPLEAVYNIRCLPEREFYLRARWILKKYPEHLRGVDLDLTEFIHGRHDSEKDRKGMLEYKVHVPAIHYMYSLINKSLVREVEHLLKKKHLIPSVKQCGNCIHRAAIEPYVCELEEIPGKIGGASSYNKHYGTDRKATDSPCAGHIFAGTFHNPIHEAGHFIQDEEGTVTRFERGVKTYPREIALAEASRDVRIVFKVLRECIKAAPSPHKAEIFKRWLLDRAYIYRHLSGRGYEAAKSKLLDQRTDSKKEREAYSAKVCRDNEKLEKCLSPGERCLAFHLSEGKRL